jgi:hypothetical protein
MLRFVEIGMFAAPFALYAVWLMVGRRLDSRMFWIAVIGLSVIGAGTVWFGLERSLPPDAVYVPAHIEDGRIVQGRGVSR